jgi:GT2 family glycosyltransferase
MKYPSVTVIVTVKNSKDTIGKCINSLLLLNYPNYKIYVTDAFSTDGTYDILKCLQKKNPKKIKIEQVKGNIAESHNYMIRKISTELIAMTDSDCIVDKSWLKNLVLGFNSKEVIATAGFCSTPKGVNNLQNLIGLELESRFKNFPEFISRAPTMNLCVKSSFAKKVKFNEKLDVAQETEWGYRLTELGKMRYAPNAVIYHYHRPKLKNFFIQQYKYGKHMPIIYFKMHKDKITGDHISTPSILLQLLLFDVTMLFLLSSVFFNFLIIPTALLIIFLILFFLSDIVRITTSPKKILGLLLIYFFRSIAWTLGVIAGIVNLLKR